MRALAELITSGRTQAAIVGFFGNIIPLVSPAAVSLVTLTKGLSEGALLSLYAATPLMIMIYASDANTVVTMLSIFTVVCVLLVSSIMRLRSSWSEALFFITVFSVISTVFTSIFFNSSLIALENIISDFFENNQHNNDFTLDRNFLLGIASYIIALTSIASLILGRWWQAMLFNPGGFKLEFHQLRFSSSFSVIILMGMFACEFFLDGHTSWFSLLSLPLMLGGIALFHFSVNLFQLGSFWLVGFYLALLLLSPTSIILVGIGFFDSIFNIRPKLSRYVR